MGLADLGVDPAPGTRDEAERVFGRIVRAGVDLGQWRYAVFGVQRRRSLGVDVANPIAYAWRIL